MKIKCLLEFHDWKTISLGKGIYKQKRNGPGNKPYTDEFIGPAKKVQCRKCGKKENQWNFNWTEIINTCPKMEDK